MTDGNFELSRRKVLGSMGLIGIAGAGAGFGTSAFFSDDEEFANNSLVAGELDVKVDWEEHYSDWMGDEDADPDSDGTLDIQMNVSDPTGYTAFPPGVEAFDGVDGDEFVTGDPLLYVADDDVAQFMDNTSIEAFPDSDNDGVQDDFVADDDFDPCEDLVDVGTDDGGLSADARTNNDVTSPGDPLVSLQDVKPGDFGEVTFSFHICDNPGYVWLNAGNVSAAENGKTEPEREDEDESSEPDPTVDGERVELLDQIQTAWWYDDNCDNLTSGGAGAEETDVMLVFDKSESMNSYPNDSDPQKLQSAVDGGKALVDSLGGNTRAGLTVFADGIDQNTGVARPMGSAGADIKADLDGLIGPDDYRPGSKINDDGGEYNGTDPNDEDNLNFETQTGVGIKAAREELLASNPDSNKVMVILSDGNPVDDEEDASTQATISKDAGIEIYTIAYGSGANVSLMEGWASEPKDTHAFVAPDPGDVESVFGQIGQNIRGEEIFFQGPLRTALTALTTGVGIPLDGDGGNDFDEINAVLGDGDPTAAERGCFEPTPATNCIGFSWWLPIDHGNEVQSDSVSFDLGFYTEQCRHNDGSGT